MEKAHNTYVVVSYVYICCCMMLLFDVPGKQVKYSDLRVVFLEVIQALKLQFKGQFSTVMKSPDVADMLGGKYKSMVSDACRLQCVHWVCSACVGICVLDVFVYRCV